MRSELRKDYIQDKYVIIAPRRGRRPHDVEKPLEAKKTPHIVDTCHFCPKNIDKESFIMTIGPARKNWKIKVIPNKFPAVRMTNPKAFGKQEVVIETPRHDLELEELPVTHIHKLLDVYAARTAELSMTPKMQYVLIFKNNGGLAGASLKHAHSQIFATNFIPPHLFDKSMRAHSHIIRHGHCAYCAVIRSEAEGPRLIWHDDYITVFAPYASLHNYEAWIMPKRHVDNITQLQPVERRSFSQALKNVLTAIGYLHLPYNYYFHQVINDTDQHLYMKVIPRGSLWAGVEIGSGVIINPIAPEDAAAFYRNCFNGACKIVRA